MRFHVRIWGVPKGSSVLLKGWVGMGSLLGLCRSPIVTEGCHRAARGCWSPGVALVTSFCPLQEHGGSSELESQRPPCNEATAGLRWRGQGLHVPRRSRSSRGEQSVLLPSPCREPVQQAALYSQQWSLQRGMHSVKNLSDPRKRCHWFLFVFTP